MIKNLSFKEIKIVKFFFKIKFQTKEYVEENIVEDINFKKIKNKNLIEEKINTDIPETADEKKNGSEKVENNTKNIEIIKNKDEEIKINKIEDRKINKRDNFKNSKCCLSFQFVNKEKYQKFFFY